MTAAYHVNRLPILITLLFLLSASACAQYTDDYLYDAYLRRDMGAWKAYLDATDWGKASIEERRRYLNYEYGFIAPAIDNKEPWAEDYLVAFKQHVAEMYQGGHIPEAHYYMYMSSICAYDFLLHSGHLFSSGLKAFKHVRKATELAPDDPFVLTLMANVEFYAPSGFGGDKKEALAKFTKAQRIFESTMDCHNLWNYASMRLCIAQCYDKAGDIHKAIRICQDILATIPNFEYIRDEYLPDLQQRATKK